MLLYQPKLALSNLFNIRLARNYLDGLLFPCGSKLRDSLNWALNLVNNIDARHVQSSTPLDYMKIKAGRASIMCMDVIQHMPS